MTIRAYSIPHLLSLLVMILPLAGCGPIYLPAIYDSSPPPSAPLVMDKPHTYAGANVQYSDGFNDNESHLMGQGYAAWGAGGRWGRGMAVGFIYGGDYHVTASENVDERGHRGYSGIGVMFDGNIAIKSDDIALGVGGNAGFATEYGSYAALWKNDKSLNIAPMVGCYAFVAGKIGKDQWAELQCHLGLPGVFSTNLQFNLGDFQIWGGVGSTRGSSNGIGLGRFAVGVAKQLD